MTVVHREIMSRYRVDGLFINRWDGSGMCYCQHCVANFKDATGFDLPRSGSEHGPSHRAYLFWRQERLISLLDIWNAEIRKINSEAAIIPNNGSGALTALNALETSRRAPMLAADRQARHGLAAPWLIGKTAKEYRATMGDKPIIGLFGLGWRTPIDGRTALRATPKFVSGFWALLRTVCVRRAANSPVLFMI